MGSFIQNEILGMAWLERLIGSLLTLCGLDIESKIGGSVLFFIYDTIKINAFARRTDSDNLVYSELFPAGAN